MPSKLPHFALRTSRQLMNKFKYVAEYNGRSANKELEQLVKQHVGQFEQAHGVIPLRDDEE
jgi:hypothetical protein